MAKIATVKLTWTRSPSADVERVEGVLTVDGTTTRFDVGPEVEEWTVEIRARSTVQFRVDTFDNEGNYSQSTTLAFVLGDLEAPLPATNLGFEIIGVRDEPEPEPAPSPSS